MESSAIRVYIFRFISGSYDLWPVSGKPAINGIDVEKHIMMCKSKMSASCH